MFCKKCGNQINPGEKFCGRCGTPVDLVQPATSVPPIAPTSTIIPTEADVKPSLFNYDVNQNSSSFVNQAVIEPVNKVKKNPIFTIIKIVIGLIVGGFITLALLIILVPILLTGILSKDKEVKFGDDKISTVYALLGGEEVVYRESSTTNDYSRETYRYDLDEFTEEEIIEYFEILMLDEDFINTPEEGLDIMVSKESVDDGKIISVSAKANDDTVDIIYLKYEGTLVRY